MAAITIRNLSPEAHRALKKRAIQHGRSTEAEVRDILEQAALPGDRIKLGTLLAEISQQASLTQEDEALFKAALSRETSPASPIRLK